MRPGRWSPRCGAASGGSRAVLPSVSLRPEYFDPEATLEGAAEAIFHLGPFIGHGRRSQEAALGLDLQHGEGGTVFRRNGGQLLFERLDCVNGARARKSGGTRDRDVVCAALVDYRQRADCLVNAVGNYEMFEIFHSLRGFGQQTTEIHAQRSVRIQEPDSSLR